jgi:23S rRNA (cytosine1962-C5)-methyltransferase
MSEVIIRKDKKGYILNMHPWISAEAFEPYAQVKDKVVEVLDEKHKFIAWALLNKKSTVPIKILSYDKKIKIDEKFFAKQINKAVEKRQKQAIYRAFNSESDGIPGLFIDVFGDVVVYEITASALLFFEKIIIEAIKTSLSPKYIATNGRMPVRILEKLELFDLEWVGKGPKSNSIVVEENGIKYCIDLKKGFSTIQRSNREILPNFAEKMNVLTLFCHNNGIVEAIKKSNPAQITSIDFRLSDTVEQAYAINGFKKGKDKFIVGDVYTSFKKIIAKAEQYDLVFIDYPDFVKSFKESRQAVEAITALLGESMKMLNTDGNIVFCLNGGFISPTEFISILKTASARSKVRMQIYNHALQSSDFPALSSMPESNIFNCVWMQKMG